MIATTHPQRNPLREVADALSAAWAALGPARTADLLGLRAIRRGRNVLVCCPWHDDRTPSCSISIGAHGTIRVHCFSCGKTWDVHSLIARINGLDPKTDWPKVLKTEAELLNRTDLTSLQHDSPTQSPPPLHPPARVVDFLLGRCVRVDQDQAVSAYLRRRGLDPSAVAIRDIAYALPQRARLPRWCRFAGRTWPQTGHRLLLPVYDYSGDIAGVRAVRIIDNDTPKRLSPAGHTLSGTVLADSTARIMLRAGTLPPGADVVITEGEPDFLSAAIQIPLYETPRRVVLGVYSGSWCSAIAARIPDGTCVRIIQHDDHAGAAYARTIHNTLSPRCQVLVLTMGDYHA